MGKKKNYRINDNSSVNINEHNGNNNSNDLSDNNSIITKIYMWEFDQNDPKRDSGTKLCRLGLAKTMRIGCSYNGIVLSSETSNIINKSDIDIVIKYGISGINCSWNKLDEIPFNRLGKSKNHRLLPLLFAANSVNYGKPYKLNTAEAIASALYICGMKDEAILLLSSFSYGEEFFRLNNELFEMYSCCNNSNEIQQIQEQYINERNNETSLKQQIKSNNEINNSCISNNYIDENDLPPVESDDDDYYIEESLLS